MLFTRFIYDVIIIITIASIPEVTKLFIKQWLELLIESKMETMDIFATIQGQKIIEMMVGFPNWENLTA